MPHTNRYNVASSAAWRALHPWGVVLGTLKGLSMEKWLCWGSLGVAGISLLLFLMDMLLGIPFGGIGYLVNGIGIVACGLVGYLAWESFKEMR
jgi:hypothetical protein